MIKTTPSPFTNSKFIIPANQPRVKLLFNQMSDIVKKEQTGGIFTTDKIEISTALKSQETNILNKLTEMGAKFKLVNIFK